MRHLRRDKRTPARFKKRMSSTSLYQCDQCGRGFESREDVLDHIHTHSTTSCEHCKQCGKCFSTEDEHERHNELIHSENKPFQCQICNRRYLRISTYNCHMKTHRKERPHVCPHCDKTFCHKYNLNLHIRTHTGEKNYQCPECGKIFGAASTLNRHRLIHQNARNYHCTICDKRFLQSNDYKIHMSTHIGYRRFECDVCQKKFTMLCNLKKHRLRGHDPSSETGATGEWRKTLYSQTNKHNRAPGLLFKCKICHAAFSDRKQVRKHIKVHELNCHICQRFFETNMQLQRHMEMHGEKPQLKCPICPISFVLQVSYDKHLETVHKDDKPITCEVCGQVCYRHNIKTHKMRHLGQKVYDCTVCGKEFVHASSFTRHQSSHNEERNFECSVCGKRFLQKVHLKVHQKVHANVLVEPSEVQTPKLNEQSSVQVFNCDKEPFIKKYVIGAQLTLSQRKQSTQSKNTIYPIQYEFDLNEGINLINDDEDEYFANTDTHFNSDINEDDTIPYSATQVTLNSESFNEYNPNNTSCSSWDQNCVQYSPFDLDQESSSIDSAFNRNTVPNDPPPIGELVANGLSPPNLSENSVQKYFYCTVCCKKFSEQMEYDKHFRTHTQIPVHYCPICNETLPSQTTLQIHVAKHNDETPVTCEFCQEVIAKQNYETHMHQHSGTYPYRCACGKKFSYANGLVRHKANKHSTNGKYNCMECFRNFVRINDFKNHMRKHKSLPAFKCRYEKCRYTFYGEDRFVRHMKRIHPQEPVFLCTWECGETFESDAQRQNHTIECRFETAKEPAEDAAEKESDILSHHFECDLCDEIFETKEDIIEHMQEHTDPKKRYRCNFCGKMYLKKSDYVKHCTLHADYRPFKCDVCDKSFAQKKTYRNHMILHRERKPYQCPKCLRSYCHNYDMKKHLQTHDNAKPYGCDICKKRFAHNVSLTRHLRSHAGERNYECCICLKSYKQSCHLTRHMKIHTNDRQFHCSICDRRFYDSYTHRKHMVAVHSSETPFLCERCGEGFADEAVRDKHMIEHGEQE